MLSFQHEKTIPDAFNIDSKEMDEFIATMGKIAQHKREAPITWAVERIWIDENFSDNLKAYAIFQLGYVHCLQKLMGGGEMKT